MIIFMFFSDFLYPVGVIGRLSKLKKDCLRNSNLVILSLKY